VNANTAAFAYGWFTLENVGITISRKLFYETAACLLNATRCCQMKSVSSGLCVYDLSSKIKNLTACAASFLCINSSLILQSVVQWKFYSHRRKCFNFSGRRCQ